MSVYGDEELRQRLFEEIKGAEVYGTAAGKWSARKAQYLAKRYKEEGGTYLSPKSKKQLDLDRWTAQRWRTKSGKPSHITGERYLPEEAIAHLSAEEYERTSRRKRVDTEAGKQFSRQPSDIASKVKPFRTGD